MFCLHEICKHSIFVAFSAKLPLDCLTVSSLCRNQGLEKVLGVLQDEIHKLEHNDTVLKDMEKDLTVHHSLFSFYLLLFSLFHTFSA